MTIKLRPMSELPKEEGVRVFLFEWFMSNLLVSLYEVQPPCDDDDGVSWWVMAEYGFHSENFDNAKEKFIGWLPLPEFEFPEENTDDNQA